ncbi:hypothetical protein GOODEAATRI_007176 [Goodea atripinnis]|uniref:Uncharacterized protein n=1 Tax=Goodea atripinnis TaxID=208336 RepID=A0ABV0NI59_9TELE
MCGHATKRASRSVETPPLHQPPAVAVARDAQPSDSDETLAGLRREFITNLKGFSSFYSGLGEALCSREPAPANNSLCWNGQEMTDRTFSRPRHGVHWVYCLTLINLDEVGGEDELQRGQLLNASDMRGLVFGAK